jgi:predicted ribosome quality control (RQC) complex YloA/Tae2 family protein
MNKCLDSFFHKKGEHDQLQQRAHVLIRRLNNEINKNDKKVRILTKELAQVEEAEQLRLYGELITAQMHQVKRGNTSLHTIDFYDPEAREVTIPLSPIHSPSQNAQRYFKKYQKIKTSKKWNEEQIKKAQEENTYLESVLMQLEQSSISEIEQIRVELQEEGWIKAERKKEKRKKEPIPLPTTVYSSQGIIILIGKNNKQNDHLTHRLASSSDTWLHVKDIPGSHVVIRGREIPEATLREAAMMAAYFSKGRYSSGVPVDFTLVKYVKKPSGSRPGFVIYDHQQTIYVTPDEEVVNKLLTATHKKG